MTALQKSSVALLAGLVLVLGGCFYDFHNPVQLQQNGSISGQVTLQNAAAGQTTENGTVGVAFSGGLNLTLDSTGKFAFLALPDGTYALNLFFPPLAQNDFPLQTVLNGVLLPASNGVVDALDLGTISVQPSGQVIGTVTNAQGAASAVVAAFAPGVDGGLGTYEGFATPTDAGRYAFYLPAGEHVLASSDSSLSLLAPITLQAKQVLTQDFALDGGQGAGFGIVEGNLVFGGPDAGAHASASAIDPLLPGIQFAARDPNGTVVASGTVFASSASQVVGIGATFGIQLPAGQPLDVAFTLPDTSNPQGTNHFDPLVLKAMPALAGQTTYLGQVTWLPVSTFIANEDAGVGDGGTNATGGTAGGGTGGTSGLTTGGTGGSTTTGGTGGTGSTGGTGATNGGALSQWTLVGSLDLAAGDGGPPTVGQVLALPLDQPLGVHGYRLVWVQDFGPTANVFFSDDPGGFGPPQAVTNVGWVQPGTMSAIAVDGGSVVSWVSVTSGFGSAFVPTQEGGAQAITVNGTVQLSMVTFQGTATVAGSLNGVAGTFVIGPDSNGGLAVLFTSDYQTFHPYTVSIDLGGSVYPNNVVAVPCQVPELNGGAGFCVAGSGGIGSTTSSAVIFAAVIDTSGAQPVEASLQKLIDLASGEVFAYLGLAALPGVGGDIVYLTASLEEAGNPTEWTSFTSLAATAPLLQSYPANFIEQLLPWAGQILGLSSQAYDPVGTTGYFVPSGATATGLLPDFVGGYPTNVFALAGGYVDPVTGQPTAAFVSADGGTLAIYSLPATPSAPPDGGIVPDAGVISADGGWTLSVVAFGVDGGQIIETIPLPIPLPAGGWGHRLVWIQNPSPAVYVADDTSGTFGAPLNLYSGSLATVLLGASDPSGNSLAAWTTLGDSGFYETLAAYLPASGPIAPVQIPDPGLRTALAVASIPLGLAILGDEVIAGVMRIAVTVDGGSYGFSDVRLTDGGGYLGTLVATPCVVDDLAGNAGFCLAGTLTSPGGGEDIFAAAISLAGTSPSLAGFQTLQHSTNTALLPTMTSLPPLGSGSTPVTVAWIDPSVSSPAVLWYAQFTSLAQAVTASSLSETGSSPRPPLLLPWRGGPLAIFDIFSGSSLVRSAVLPPGSSAPPPDVMGASLGRPAGYVDPQTGGLVVTPDGLISTALELWQIAP